MVLYHLSTTYQLLYCIVHRLARHADEEAGLLMVEYIRPESERKAFIQKLLDTGWFSFVRLVPENQFKLKRGNALTETSPPQEIDAVIHNICTCVENWLQLDLSTFSRIYIGSDQWSFGIYCLANKIPHVYIEDASGMLSQRERYMQITKEICLTNYVISEYLHGAGTSEYEIARLCDERNFLDGFTDEKAENFSIYDALSNEIPHRVPEILAFYDVAPVSVSDNEPVCMYMTQYLKSMAVKDLDVQEQITTMLVDYFSEGCRLVIKPHPKDIWLNYRRIFPEAVLLPCRMNSELIPFLFDKPVKRVLTASSTSVGGMAPFSEEIYQFTTEIETRHEHLHAIYTAAMLLGEFVRCTGQPVRPVYEQVNRTQVENFLRILKIPTDSEKGWKVRITENTSAPPPSEETPEALLLILDENAAEPPAFCLPENQTVLLVNVSLSPEENSLFSENEYTLFFIINRPTVEKCISSFAFVRHLPFSKVKLYVQSRILSREEIREWNQNQERE